MTRASIVRSRSRTAIAFTSVQPCSSSASPARRPVRRRRLALSATRASDRHRMPLFTGTRLGSYEIISPLGAGGMGEVYRALDTRLKRQVAIKVLPVALATDSARLARFQREAEVLASLNHPHIAAVYGLEELPDSQALVMELVEG